MKKTIAVVCLLGLPLLAQSQTASMQTAKKLAPFLDGQAIIVGEANLDAINLDAIFGMLKDIAGKELNEKEFQAFKTQTNKQLSMVRAAGMRRVWSVITLSRIPQDPVLLIFPIDKGADPNKIIDYLTKQARVPAAKVMGKFVVAGNQNTINNLQVTDAKPSKDLVDALTASEKSSARLLVLLPDALRKSLADTLPNLPPTLGGMSTEPITKGFRWAAMTMNLPPDMNMNMTVQAANGKSAKGMRNLLEKLVEIVKGLPNAERELGPLMPLMDKYLPKVNGDQLETKISGKEFVAMVAPAVVNIRQAAARNQSMNNLKQIGLAMHNSHDTYRAFPARYFADKNGKPLLSWRVHILPFIGHADLYNQFKLDEPWDSPNNKKLIAKMPQSYRSPNSKAGPNLTTYVTPVYKDSIFSGAEGMKIQKILDGTSNTIMVVEANDKNAVIWTKPDDIEINAKNPIDGLIQANGRGFNALFADGSVRFIASGIDAATLRALFTASGGEVVGQVD